MRGFEIFFESLKSQFHSKLDVIISLAHFLMLEDHLCTGVGENVCVVSFLFLIQ